MRRILIACIFIFATLFVKAEDGHNLWLRNSNPRPVNAVCTNSSTMLTSARQELQQEWQGEANSVVTLQIFQNKDIFRDGFKLSKNEIQVNTELGILYGVYELLRRQHHEKFLNEISLVTG